MSRRDLNTNQPFVEFFREFRDSSMMEKILFISLAVIIVMVYLETIRAGAGFSF